MDDTLYENPITTFIVPSIKRSTLRRAIESAEGQALVRFKIDINRTGPSAIRNELIAQARTTWVSMLDDDDTVTDDYVQRLREEWLAHPDADVIIFREYFPKEDKFIWQQPIVKWGNVGIAFSVRREVALKFPFKQVTHEDLDFLLTLQNAGKKIIFSKYIVYRCRH